MFAHTRDGRAMRKAIGILATGVVAASALVDKVTTNSAGVKIVQVYTYSGHTLKFRQDQLTVVPSDC